MWTRANLKALGKISFKRVYWKAVVVCLIVTFITSFCQGGNNNGSGVDYSYTENQTWESNNLYTPEGVIPGVDFFNTDSNESGFTTTLFENGLVDSLFNNSSNFISQSFSTISTGAIVGMGVVIFILAMAVSIFILNPILIGQNYFFMGIRHGERDIWDIFILFKNKSFIKAAITMFFMDLFIFLWTLLLIIPGIYKGLEYLMIPYILAENPEIDRRRAFELSKEMMDGHKWDTFVLGLSFIGWELLSGLTFGILGIFYVNPYRQATYAELYAVLRQNVLDRQITNQLELPGF